MTQWWWNVRCWWWHALRGNLREMREAERMFSRDPETGRFLRPCPRAPTSSPNEPRALPKETT